MRLAAAAAVLVALTAGHPGHPDVTVLAHRATKLLHSQTAFRKAQLLEVDGSPAKKFARVKTARSVVNWWFVFDNQATGSKYASAYVRFRNGKFGAVQGETNPFEDDQVISPIPTMTLARAIKRLNFYGYRTGFYTVTLRKPLDPPGVKHAEYVFALTGGVTRAIDAVTGKIKPAD